MFVSKFSTEQWQGNRNKSLVSPVRDWQEIEAAIKELDGKHQTLVTLETDGETHMAVGGGRDKYVVYLTFDNETFYSLVEPSKPDTEESLNVGGQIGVYPARLCVEISTALKAAKTFAEVGKMDRSITWEKDGAIDLVSHS